MPSETITALKPFPAESIAWTEWSEAPRFALRYRHLSRAGMGEGYRVGVAMEELAPGKQSSPAHYHIFEEEHVFILDGSVTLRLGAETHEMKAGDYACFPAGQKAGHCLVNTGGAVCRYVIIGERNPNEVAVYTDSNKVLVRALGRRALFDLAATRGYWEGEDTGLPANAAEALDAARFAPEPPAKGKPPISSRDLPWDEFPHGKGFFDRNKHLTFNAVGENARVGVLIEAPPPGMRGAPRHYHMLEEEHALILEGEVTLLLGDERHAMKAGDFVSFPAGHAVGHSFLNSGAGPCSYLMIGERNPADVCVYPDSNKMAVNALDAVFDLSAVREYWDGEQTG